MMVKLLVYGYAMGVLCSRRLAQKLEEDVAFRVLAAGNRPQHRILCAFRRRHRADLGAVLVAVVQLARDLGLASLTTLVPDGTKVRAHARQRKAMSYGRRQQEEARLSAEIEKLQAAAEALDAAEDAQHGLDLRGDEVPVALQRRESRRAAIRAALAALEARARAEMPADPPAATPADTPGETPEETPAEPPVTPAPKTQYNFTDPESRLMKTSQDGFPPCSNAQIVGDGDSQLIVTTAVSPQASDQGQLPRRLDAVQAHYSHTPTTVLADAGSRHEGDLQDLENRGIDGYVALGRERHTASERRPQGPATQRMACKLDTPQGHDTYAPRKWLLEAPISWIKRMLGFRPFGLRRLAPCPGRVGSGVSGPARQAPAPPAHGLTHPRLGSHGPEIRLLPPALGPQTPIRPARPGTPPSPEIRPDPTSACRLTQTLAGAHFCSADS